jgi:hypothetical protein
MSMISNSDLTTILDKLARFASEAVGDPEFAAGLTAGFDTASTDVFGPLATFILALNEEDQVADLLPAARDLDEHHPAPPTGFLLNVAGVNAMLTALDTHFKRFGYKGVDDRLTAINTPTPTLRAHGLFRRYLGKITAGNSFIPNDIALAQIVATGAATGTFTHLAAIDKVQYAGAKVVAKNVGALDSDTAVSVTGVKLDGTTATLTASITVHTDAHETNLSDTTMKFVNVTAISISGATSTNQINIVAKTDRSIASA